MTVVRVGVFGAAGRMGQAACAAVAADPELDLVVGLTSSRGSHDWAGGDESGHRVALLTDLTSVNADALDVVVDFTTAAVARADLAWCAANAVHAVVGTTGLDEGDLAELRRTFTSSNCLVVPNFAVGAVLLMRFAELAAPWFDSVEIVELHHDAKVDAPSGTALLTAQRLAAASTEWTPDPTEDEVLDGARGGLGPAGIRVHSVRLRGLVAHQEVLLGGTGQTLTLRHDSYDRSSFMPGVVLALKRVAELPGVTIGLDAVLGR